MTLVEVLVVGVASMVVMGGIGTVFLAGRNAYFTTDAKISGREQIRQAYDYLERDLQDARILSFCNDETGNGCPGGVAAKLRVQLPVLLDPSNQGSFFDGTKVNWDIANPVTYQWRRGAGAPPAPTALNRCVGGICHPIAPRATNITFVPVPADGTTVYPATPPASPFYGPGPAFIPTFASTAMPALVDITIQVASAQTSMSPRVPRFQPANPFRIRLRNIQQ